MTYYVTTPIYYVNDRPHVGHCYTTVLADCLARFNRMALGDPNSVFFLTGTDEHAEKVVTTAAEHNLSPIQWADQNSDAFMAAFGSMGYTFDDFIRTTQPRHKDKVTAYITDLMTTGDVYLGEYEGWYDVNDEAYVTETKAKETDFKAANGKPLVKRREKNYYFKLSKYQAWLEQSIASGELRIEPEARKNEVLGRLREGLDDVPISRPITNDPATAFGIRMPGDESHRIYVWIDALFNYLTAVDTPDRIHFWPPNVHLIGKEIVWFHAVIWPALLKALNRPLPRLLYAHSHYVREGKKMSKSLGNFIDIDTMNAYTNRFGVDALRWYLATQGPLGATDADFTHAKFIEVYNAELANGIGNCASRVANMIEKYFNGTVPDHASRLAFQFPRPDQTPGSNAQQAGILLTQPPPLEIVYNWADETHDSIARATRLMRQCHISDALLQGIALVSRVDSFINTTQPFKLAKQPGEDARTHLASILYCCAEALRIASLLLAPGLPTTMQTLWKAWHCEPAAGVPLAEVAQFAGPHGLKPGAPLVKTEALFMRADPAEAPPA